VLQGFAGVVIGGGGRPGIKCGIRAGMAAAFEPALQQGRPALEVHPRYLHVPVGVGWCRWEGPSLTEGGGGVVGWLVGLVGLGGWAVGGSVDE
jgi:hypothetical protein